MSLSRLRSVSLGRDRARTGVWLLIGCTLAVLGFVDGYYEGLDSLEVHAFWIFRLLWPLLGISLAVGQAYQNRSLLASWGLVLGPALGETLYMALEWGAFAMRAPTSTSEQVTSALLFALFVTAILGTGAFLIGRAGERLLGTHAGPPHPAG